MKKTIMCFALIMMLSLTLVSARTLSNIETSYDKKSGFVHIELDETLNNECRGVNVNVLDHKGNIVDVVPVWTGGFSISCITQGGVALWGGKTGTFHSSYDIELVDKRYIKGLSKLSYELTTRWPQQILDEGLL